MRRNRTAAGPFLLRNIKHGVRFVRMDWTRRTPVLLALTLALAAGGCTRREFQRDVPRVTGPPTSGINSSAPNAVDQAAGGVTSGGANAFTGVQKKVTPSPQP